MSIDNRENAVLNLYRASELHGGLILGQVVRRATDSRLIVNLTRHAAEQLVNARIWTETIIRGGGTLLAAVETLYDRRVSKGQPPVSIRDALSVVQMVERQTHAQLVAHLGKGDVHPLFDDTLKRMIDVERRHIDWVNAWLRSNETEPVSRARPAERAASHPNS
jgi:uncharacterized protein YbjT (DUF2867 family)